MHFLVETGFPGGANSKEPSCQCGRHKRCRFNSWVRKIPWRRAWQPTPILLPGESHGQRSLAGCSPKGRTGSGMTEATEHTCTHSTDMHTPHLCGHLWGQAVVAPAGVSSFGQSWQSQSSHHIKRKRRETRCFLSRDRHGRSLSLPAFPTEL